MAALALAALSGAASVRAESNPQPPAALVPKGYEVHEAAKGDLSKDGLDDWAFTASRPADKKPGEGGSEREPLFVVALRKPGSVEAYETVVSSATTVCFGCGGMKAPPDLPVGEPRIEKGILIVGYVGGARETWSHDFKWRWAKDHFDLIGETYSSDDSLGGEADPGWTTGVDINFATGKANKTVTDAKGKPREQHCHVPKSFKKWDLKTFSFDGHDDVQLEDCR
jgi:hypothetical protein